MTTRQGLLGCSTCNEQIPRGEVIHTYTQFTVPVDTDEGFFTRDDFVAGIEGKHFTIAYLHKDKVVIRYNECKSCNDFFDGFTYPRSREMPQIQTVNLDVNEEATIADYAHHNEDAERIWAAEQSVYDNEPSDDDYDDRDMW